ncbi:hypothetical protein [Nocardia sp. NPDC052566]|uniref:hypothetical protein n=1 Tax=Nocardia sp. NPDC052566 TaxID=3364330 RepID=UPI0037C57926
MPATSIILVTAAVVVLAAGIAAQFAPYYMPRLRRALALDGKRTSIPAQTTTARELPAREQLSLPRAVCHSVPHDGYTPEDAFYVLRALDNCTDDCEAKAAAQELLFESGQVRPGQWSIR